MDLRVLPYEDLLGNVMRVYLSLVLLSMKP